MYRVLSWFPQAYVAHESGCGWKVGGDGDEVERCYGCNKALQWAIFHSVPNAKVVLRWLCLVDLFRKLGAWRRKRRPQEHCPSFSPTRYTHAHRLPLCSRRRTTTSTFSEPVARRGHLLRRTKSPKVNRFHRSIDLCLPNCFALSKHDGCI